MLEAVLEVEVLFFALTVERENLVEPQAASLQLL